MENVLDLRFLQKTNIVSNRDLKGFFNKSNTKKYFEGNCQCSTDCNCNCDCSDCFCNECYTGSDD